MSKEEKIRVLREIEFATIQMESSVAKLIELQQQEEVKCLEVINETDKDIVELVDSIESKVLTVYNQFVKHFC